MKRAGSWGIVRSSLAWIALILLASGSATANPLNPIAASGNKPASQNVSPNPEIEAPPSQSAPVVKSPSQSPETEASSPDGDTAVQSTPSGPELEAATQVSNPVSEDNAPAAQSESSDPEIEAPPSESAPATQSPSPSPEIEAPPPDRGTAVQSTPSGPEPEAPTQASDPAAESITQKPAIEEPTPASVSAVKGNKSILKVMLQNAEMDITLTSGLRKDDFQWSIAGNIFGTGPNILSELTWSDVDSYQLGMTNRILVKRWLYIRSEFSYAFIQNGRIQDSDFRLDNRGDEFSRSISNGSGDQIWDISFAAGYPFFFLEDRLTVAPLLGYAYRKQNFRITDGEQVITDPDPDVPDLGPLPGLNSTYRAKWQGPWIGCDLRYRLPGTGDDESLAMEFGFSVGFHFADYEADANWNLRSDLAHPVSFEHKADGVGIALAGEWLIDMTDNWDFVFQASYQHWETDHGDDYAHKVPGPSEQTRLNEVVWSNYSFMVGANFHF